MPCKGLTLLLTTATRGMVMSQFKERAETLLMQLAQLEGTKASQSAYLSFMWKSVIIAP